MELTYSQRRIAEMAHKANEEALAAVDIDSHVERWTAAQRAAIVGATATTPETEPLEPEVE